MGRGPAVPYPVFVLTHHVRPSIEMKGGTTFHFIDASPAEALAAAREAAGGLDVRIGGGPAAVRQFLAAGLIDHMHSRSCRSSSAAAVPLGRPGGPGGALRHRVGELPSGSPHVTGNRRSRTGLTCVERLLRQDFTRYSPGNSGYRAPGCSHPG